MKYTKSTTSSEAPATITVEQYVFEDGERWWFHQSEFTVPGTDHVVRDTWVTSDRRGPSRLSELDRKIKEA